MLYSSYTISMFYKKRKEESFYCTPSQFYHTLGYTYVNIKIQGRIKYWWKGGLKPIRIIGVAFFSYTFLIRKCQGQCPSGIFQKQLFFGVYLECRKVVEQKINKIVLDCDGLFISVPTRVWSQYCLYNIYKTF